jgi:hypothetical protein
MKQTTLEAQIVKILGSYSTLSDSELTDIILNQIRNACEQNSIKLPKTYLGDLTIEN